MRETLARSGSSAGVLHLKALGGVDEPEVEGIEEREWRGRGERQMAVGSKTRKGG